MAAFNRNLGMWRASNGGYYATQAEAEAAESSGAQSITYDESEFAANAEGNAREGVELPDWLRAGSPVITADQATRNNEMFAKGYTDLTGDGRIDAADEKLSKTPYGTPVSQGGTATEFQVEQVPIGSYNATRGTYAGGVQGVTVAQPGISQATPTGQRYDEAAAATQRAESEFNAQHGDNAAENATAWGRAWDQFDNLEATDYGMSDEARGYQREGLQQQRELLERMLGFDPNQYATQFADQALARSVALGRSQGGGAAAQQAGVFAALEQAPALQAEGARQAAQLENQRLGMAQTAAKSFGELGTMTRGQDEGRAQFESTLAVNIADSVARLSQGQVQLNQQESQMFADMWMDFARFQSVYAGMSSQEQIAWWQTEAQKRGQDKQFDAVMAQIRAQGAVDDKDILDGLFQLGGTLLGGVGGILGA